MRAVPAVATLGTATRRGLAVVVAAVVTVGLVGLISGSRSGWFSLGITALITPIAGLTVAGNRAKARTVAGTL